MRHLGLNVDGLRRRIFRNWTMISAGGAVSSLLTVLTLTVTARALGPEQFGVLVMVQVYVLIIASLVSFQTWQGLIRYGVEALHNNNTLSFVRLIKLGFAIDVMTAILGFGIALAGAAIFERVQHLDEDSQVVLFMYCLFILCNASGTATAVIRALDRFVLTTIARNGAGVVRIAVVGALWLTNNSSLIAFAMAWLVGDIVAFVFLVALARRELKRRGMLRFAEVTITEARREYPRLWSYLWASNLSSTLRLATQELDNFIVGGLLGPAAAGVYRLGKTYADSVLRLGEPLQQVVYPELAGLWFSEQHAIFRKTVLQVNALAGAMGLAGVAISAVASEPIIILLAGEGFRQSAGVWFVQSFALAIYMGGIGLTPAVLCMDKQVEIPKAFALGTVGFYAVIFWLVHAYGPVGGSLAQLIFHTIWFCRMNWVLFAGELHSVSVDTTLSEQEP